MKTVNVIMVENPEEIRAESNNEILTVYKNPRTQVQSIQRITGASTFPRLFPNGSTEKYSVTLQIPEDCFDEVLKSLQQEVLITEIDGILTNSGRSLQQKCAEMDQAPAYNSGNGCTIS